MTHIKTKHLTTVEPVAQFSFWVSDINDANQVEVTAKKAPVEMNYRTKNWLYFI